MGHRGQYRFRRFSRPVFPARFGAIEAARAYCQMFFRCHNTEDRCSGIALMALNLANYPRPDAFAARSGVILAAAIAAHPERFKCVVPQPPTEAISFGINPPKKEIAPQYITPHSSFD